MRQVLDGDKSLPALCGWQAARYTRGGEVAFWRDQLLTDSEELVPERLPHTARTALAGGVAAWQTIAADDDDGWRTDARHRLAARMRRLLPLCRPDGRRGGEPAAPERAGGGWHCADARPVRRGSSMRSREAARGLTGEVATEAGPQRRGHTRRGGLVSAPGNPTKPYEVNIDPPAWWREAIDAEPWQSTTRDGAVLWYQKACACPRCEHEDGIRKSLEAEGWLGLGPQEDTDVFLSCQCSGNHARPSGVAAGCGWGGYVAGPVAENVR